MPGAPRRNYHQPTAGLYRITAPLVLPNAMYGTVRLAVGDRRLRTQSASSP